MAKVKIKDVRILSVFSVLEFFSYLMGYMHGCYTLREVLKFKDVKKLESALHVKLLDIGITNFNFDLLRYQLGDVFAAAAYAKATEVGIGTIQSITGIKLTHEQRRVLASSITLTALTTVELIQAKLPHRSFDYEDMGAYLLGLCIFMHAKPICEKFLEWHKDLSPARKWTDKTNNHSGAKSSSSASLR